MAFFPKVQSPCPYKNQLATVMDGDFCRMCRRQVVDITDWSDGERVSFLAGCKEVCVSYRLRPALAAAALAAAAIPTAAAAQDQAAAPVTVAGADEMGDPEMMVVTVGGITDPANVEFASAEDLAAIPEAPVIYEDDVPAEAPAPARGPGR